MNKKSGLSNTSTNIGVLCVFFSPRLAVSQILIFKAHCLHPPGRITQKVLGWLSTSTTPAHTVYSLNLLICSHLSSCQHVAVQPFCHPWEWHTWSPSLFLQGQQRRLSSANTPCFTGKAAFTSLTSLPSSKGRFPKELVDQLRTCPGTLGVNFKMSDGTMEKPCFTTIWES